MTLTIITHALAFLAGGGCVFVYLHKNQTSAVAAATNLAAAVNTAKADLAEAKTKV